VFLYPALITGFVFVGVPLLVHLINMLRHRRRRWAAMDFLLLSYRKQRKWLRLRQLLLLLSRLALAAILVALLCGWTGGRQLLSALGGRTTHHVVILDDSYSMGDLSSGNKSSYQQTLDALAQLTQRLASDDGTHQLTVMRASRAALATRAGSEAGDVAADLSARTVTTDTSLIGRVMSTKVSAIRTDLVAALDLAGELVSASDADEQYLYIASDFRQRDWASPDRLNESLRQFSDQDLQVRMIDCAIRPDRNLAVTELAPVQDVWVAGVPVMVRATIKNYSSEAVDNVTLACRVVRYGDAVSTVDPTRRVSGEVETLPGLVIESLPPGAEITKSFQVFVAQTGTHAVEVELPPDALAIDNKRACTLPLSDVERVLVIDSDPDEAGAYTVAAVLDPGSQVRIGAVPDIKPPAFLRNASKETLAAYRAVYLVNLEEVTDSMAAALDQYVRAGGGVTWFLGDSVRADNYNARLLDQDRRLLPAPLTEIVELPISESVETGDIVFADPDTLIDPLRGAGDGTLSRIGVAKTWGLGELQESSDPEASDPEASDPEASDPEASDPEASETAGTPQANEQVADDTIARRTRYRNVLNRRDGEPFVTEHTAGAGTVVTVLSGLDTSWTNWPGDPTFVPFMLLTNARLWSGAAPSTSRRVDEPLVKRLSLENYFPEMKLIAPVDSPPRIAIEVLAEAVEADGESEESGEFVTVTLDPAERLIAGESDVDELLKPGIVEWGLLKADGGGIVLPSAAQLENGEGDLERADAAEIRRELLPLKVRFVSTADWSQENQLAGSSSIGLMLLAIAGLLLAAEQALAYWASYHTRAVASQDEAAGGSPLPLGPRRGRSESTFGLNVAASNMGGRHASETT
jgi:hypothetical protein